MKYPVPTLYRLFFPFFILSCYSGIAQAEDKLGLSLLDIPQITERQALGIYYAHGKLYDEPLFHVLDEAQIEFKFFPSVELEEGNEPPHNSHLRTLRDRLGQHTLTHLDISPNVATCFGTRFVCLGFTPISANIFARPNHLQSYFSSAVTLDLKYWASNEDFWFLSGEIKTFFDKNLVKTVKEETAILTLGRSL